MKRSWNGIREREYVPPNLLLIRHVQMDLTVRVKDRFSHRDQPDVEIECGQTGQLEPSGQGQGQFLGIFAEALLTL